MSEAQPGGWCDGDRDELATRCAELEARLAFLNEQEAQHGRLLQAIRDVSDSVFRLRGQSFFDALTMQLATVLRADVALLGNLQENGTTVSVLAMTADGQRAPDLVYSLPGSPCQDAVARRVLAVGDGLAESYPDSLLVTRLGARAYIGVALRDADGSPIGILAGLFRRPVEDVEFAETLLIFFASRAELELQQRRMERRLHAIHRLMDSDAVGFLISDMNGRVLEANDAFLKMIGYDRNDIAAGRLSWADITPPEYLPGDQLALAQLRESGVTRDLQKEYVRKDGSRVCVVVGGATLEPDHGRIVAYVLDQTERRRAERDREQLLASERAARAEAQDALQSRDRFLAALSHELRNPLMPILTAAQVLARLIPDDERIRNALRMIERNAHHQMEIIDDLLDLARVSRGTLRMSSAPLQLDRLSAEALRAVEEIATRNGLRLELQAEDGVWINADATRINQVVLNLLGNALKFTPAGGRITVRVQHVDGKARLQVEDTGRGIDPEMLGRLFTPFVQGTPSGSRPEGLGIGLTIVRSLVELQGGRVWGESEGIGRGARFVVELPAIEPPPAQVGGRAAIPGVGGVLLVEADDDARAMVAAGLEVHGLHVVACASGEEALRLAAGNAPEILLADLSLPGMDGCELLQRLHELPGCGAVPGVALLASGAPADVQRVRAAGYASQLLKPVNVGLLARHLEELRRGATASFEVEAHL